MSRITSFCAEHIGMHGPASVEAIYQAAHAAGVTTARTSASVVQALRRRASFVQLPDGNYTSAQRLLVGSVFTHRVRGERAGDSYVWPGAELEPLQALVSDLGEVPVEGGGIVSTSAYRENVWKVPADALAAVPRNGLLGFTWTGTQIRVSVVDPEPRRDDSRAREVRTVFIRHRRAAQSNGGYSYYGWHTREDTCRLVFDAIVEMPDLFAEPVPPLDELLGRSPAECVDELYRSMADELAPEHRLKLTLELPEPLYMQLEDRAEGMRTSPEEFLVGFLAQEMWRTAPRSTVPYQPRYASKQRHLAPVPNWDEQPWLADEHWSS